MARVRTLSRNVERVRRYGSTMSSAPVEVVVVVESAQPMRSEPFGVPVESRPKIVTIRVTHLAISLTTARDFVWDMYLFVELIRSVRAFIAAGVLKLSQRAAWRFWSAVSKLFSLISMIHKELMIGEKGVLFIYSMF